MRVSIQTPHHDISEEMDSTIRTKVAKLEHYYENIVDALVYLHEESNYKEVEIKLIVPNDTLFVKEQGESFQGALDVAFDTMKRQVLKYKERTIKK